MYIYQATLIVKIFLVDKLAFFSGDFNQYIGLTDKETSCQTMPAMENETDFAVGYCESRDPNIKITR